MKLDLQCLYVQTLWCHITLLFYMQNVKKNSSFNRGTDSPEVSREHLFPVQEEVSCDNSQLVLALQSQYIQLVQMTQVESFKLLFQNSVVSMVYNIFRIVQTTAARLISIYLQATKKPRSYESDLYVRVVDKAVDSNWKKAATGERFALYSTYLNEFLEFIDGLRLLVKYKCKYKFL